MIGENGWISIDDALPPIDREVLIPLGKECGIGKFIRKKNGVEVFKFKNAKFFIQQIQYWQPLPKPPKSLDDL